MAAGGWAGAAAGPVTMPLGLPAATVAGTLGASLPSVPIVNWWTLSPAVFVAYRLWPSRLIVRSSNVVPAVGLTANGVLCVSRPSAPIENCRTAPGTVVTAAPAT